MCKYMGQNSSATMLATKWSAGATPEVNRRNPLHTGNESCKGSHLDFKTQDRHNPKSKTGVSVTPQKGLKFSIYFRNKYAFQHCVTPICLVCLAFELLAGNPGKFNIMNHLVLIIKKHLPGLLETAQKSVKPV